MSLKPRDVLMKNNKTAYRIPFNKGSLDFELPAQMRGTYLPSRRMEPLADLEEAIAKALANPINAPPLRETAKPGHTVCVVFTDISRDSPDNLLVPALLTELQMAGVRDQDITLHYLEGKIRIDLVLPLSLLENEPLATRDRIAAQFAAVAAQLDDVDTISVYYR